MASTDSGFEFSVMDWRNADCAAGVSARVMGSLIVAINSALPVMSISLSVIGSVMDCRKAEV